MVFSKFDNHKQIFESVHLEPMNATTKNLSFHSIKASIVAVFLSLFGYALNHTALGAGVFLLVPFCTGLAIAFMSKGRMVAAITGMTSLLLSLSILLFAGFEGVGCVVMAFPILFISIGLGALVGFFIGKKFVKQYGNYSVVIICAGMMTVVGWTNKEMEDPELLIVQTTFKFYAPIDKVWSSVIESGQIKGDDSALRVLGLPIPYKCALDDEGIRTCYFDAGQIKQKITEAEYGINFQVDILESFQFRHWLAFKRAGYVFEQRDDHVDVIRTDEIVSTLRPRWYWSWFEEQCVRLEHVYVMSSMKREAEETVVDLPLLKE